MRRLRTRAMLLVGGGALLPLLVLGALSLYTARRAALEQTTQVNADLAERASHEIAGHVAKYESMLRRLGHILTPSLRLEPTQRDRILRTYRLDVSDLRTLDLVGRDGREEATGRPDGVTRDRAGEAAVRAALDGRSYRSAVTVSERDLVPELVLAEPIRSAGEVVGAVVATIDLTEMWRVIDGILVGDRGYARVVDGEGRLLAVGAPHLKARVFTQEKDAASPIAGDVVAGRPRSAIYRGTRREELLAVGRPIHPLGWAVLLEQPLDEALAAFHRFTRIILVLGVLLLGLAGGVGFVGARSVVTPIEKLRLRAGEIARGLLDARVEVASPEELAALAEAMNQMCADLIRLQEDVRKKERVATFGRLAAGLAHDLKHPVRALQAAAAAAMAAKPDDHRARETFRAVAERELKRMSAFLDDLRRVSRDEPMNIERASLDACDLVGGFAREQQAVAPAGIEWAIKASGPAPIEGSKDLLERVLSNLTSNAYEAMEGEGTLTLRVGLFGGCVEIAVGDTGPGIPPERLAGLWNDFGTTKKRGLGLGLAVVRRIVADHGGTIDVRSEVGRGSEFIVRLPVAQAQAAA